MSCTPFFIIQKPMAKKGEYPEFVVPATEVRGASGLVESTTLDFSVQTFQERVGQIEVKEEGQIKETESVSDFYEKLKEVKGEKRKKSQVKFDPKLRGEGGRFVSSADQERVRARYERETGKKFSALKGKNKKNVFKDQLKGLQSDKLSSDLDRSDAVSNISQRFDANPFFTLEIKGSDGRSRTYKTKQDALDALNAQLNRFYQSVGRKKKG
jgi:hypothetical protein